MKIEYTEDGDLNYDTENFDKLSKGIVIFPENLEEVERLKTLELVFTDESTVGNILYCIEDLIHNTPNDTKLGAKIRKLWCTR